MDNEAHEIKADIEETGNRMINLETDMYQRVELRSLMQ